MVTHTKVNSIPKVNDTKVNLQRELCYRSVCGHAQNTLTRSILHTWFWREMRKMDNSRELASIVSLLLLILFRQSSSALVFQLFIQRRIRRRRLHLRFINTIAHSIYYLIARRNNQACARTPRSVWVLPHPQMWFQQLLNDRALDHWWKENFRVTRGTFEYICQLVAPALRQQDTHMRNAIPVEKRVGASLWRLATGECYPHVD